MKASSELPMVTARGQSPSSGPSLILLGVPITDVLCLIVRLRCLLPFSLPFPGCSPPGATLAPLPAAPEASFPPSRPAQGPALSETACLLQSPAALSSQPQPHDPWVRARLPPHCSSSHLTQEMVSPTGLQTAGADSLLPPPSPPVSLLHRAAQCALRLRWGWGSHRSDESDLCAPELS